MRTSGLKPESRVLEKQLHRFLKFLTFRLFFMNWADFSHM
jgi:hypothetical protein